MISQDQLDYGQIKILESAEKSLQDLGWKAEGNFASKFKDGWSTPFQVEMIRSIGEVNSIFRISLSEKNVDNFALITIYDKTDNQMIRFDVNGDYSSVIDDVNSLIESSASSSIHESLNALALKESKIKINVNDRYIVLTPSNLEKVYK